MKKFNTNKQYLVIIIVFCCVFNTNSHEEKRINHYHNQVNHQLQQHSITFNSSTIFLRNRNHSQSNRDHRFNGQQCIRQKGFVCGTFIQDCCKDGCYKSWFLGPETCLNNNYLIIKQNKCEDVCKEKGGILCSNLLQDPQCCPQSACTKGLSNKCNQGKKLNITGCYQSNLMDSITGIFKS